VGTNPKLKVTYENPQSKYADFMPPDNRWFGQKTLTVQVGDVTVTRPVWFFFNPHATRTTRGLFGKTEEAWFHYYKESGAVPLLAELDFEFDSSLGASTPAQHRWNHLTGTSTYYVGFAAERGIRKSTFNVNVSNSYSETNYFGDEGKGIHAVAKYCKHERWHGELRKEIRSTLLGGFGHPDDDGDKLSNAREAELGTNPNVKDTCGISLYTDSGHADYSGYASYADNELFCRCKQDGVLGDAAKDWAAGGAQAPKFTND